jgi:hypothetical protein
MPQQFVWYSSSGTLSSEKDTLLSSTKIDEAVVMIVSLIWEG